MIDDPNYAKQTLNQTRSNANHPYRSPFSAPFHTQNRSIVLFDTNWLEGAKVDYEDDLALTLINGWIDFLKTKVRIFYYSIPPRKVRKLVIKHFTDFQSKSLKRLNERTIYPERLAFIGSCQRVILAKYPITNPKVYDAPSLHIALECLRKRKVSESGKIIHEIEEAAIASTWWWLLHLTACFEQDKLPEHVITEPVQAVPNSEQGINETQISSENIAIEVQKVLEEKGFLQVASAEKPLTQDEVINFLGISEATLIDWKKRGIIPYRKLGNRCYYDRAEVLAAGRTHEKYTKKK